MHYNESNSLLFVNATKIYANNSEVKRYSLCLGNISKDFTSIIKWIHLELNGYVYKYSVDYNIIDTSNAININKYLMKKHDIK